MSEHFWTIQKIDKNKTIVLLNGNDIGYGSIASVDVPPDEWDEFVNVISLYSNELKFYYSLY